MAPFRKGKRRISPSRRRYESTNPVVSVRLSRETYERLVKFKESKGLSMADILRIGLEMAEPDLESAYHLGMTQGYEIAVQEFEVTYWCSICRRRHLSVTSDEEKESAAQMMYQAGWHDPDCR